MGDYLLLMLVAGLVVGLIYFLTSLGLHMVSGNKSVSKYLQAYRQFHKIRLVCTYKSSDWGVTSIGDDLFIVRIPDDFVGNWAEGLEAGDLYYYKVEPNCPLNLSELSQHFQIDSFVLRKLVYCNANRHPEDNPVHKPHTNDELQGLLTVALRRKSIENFILDYIKP